MKYTLIFGLFSAVSILPELERVVADFKPKLGQAPHNARLSSVNNHQHELHLPSPFHEKSQTVASLGSVIESVEQRGRFKVTTYKEDIHLSNAKPKLSLESQKSITRNHLPNSDRQGEIGSCHIFGTLEVLHDYTGLRLSKAKAFLDHLFSKLGPDGLTGAVDLHLDQIAKTQLDIAQGALFSGCGKVPGWEAGRFLDNLKLLKEMGGVIVPNNADWKDVERLFALLENENEGILKNGRIAREDQRLKLAKAGLQEMFKKTKDPADIASRQKVKSILNGLHPVEIVHSSEMLSPVEKSIRLIKALHEKGSIYASIHGEDYYDSMAGFPVFPDYTTSGDHGVAVVGYSVSNDVFYIKDSNMDKIVKMKSKNFSVALRSAWALQRI